MNHRVFYYYFSFKSSVIFLIMNFFIETLFLYNSLRITAELKGGYRYALPNSSHYQHLPPERHVSF